MTKATIGSIAVLKNGERQTWKAQFHHISSKSDWKCLVCDRHWEHWTNEQTDGAQSLPLIRQHHGCHHQHGTAQSMWLFVSYIIVLRAASDTLTRRILHNISKISTVKLIIDKQTTRPSWVTAQSACWLVVNFPVKVNKNKTKTWPKNMEETTARPVAIWQRAHTSRKIAADLICTQLQQWTELNLYRWLLDKIAQSVN